MTRVVVVGAGVGGLSVAMRLAATGHDVTVLEQFDDVGGKLGVIEHDGFIFDTGPSLVTMPHVFEELFDATGASIHDHLTLERLAVAARYRFPDGTELDMPGTLDDIPAALDAAFGPGRGAQWSSFLERAQRVWDVTHEPFLESPMSIRTMIGGIATPTDVRTVAPWRTLRGLGEDYLDDPRLRMLLDRYATYTGSDPRRAPAALASVPWSEQAFGSWYVRGGLGRIATAMHDRLIELGGRVELGVEVDRISVDHTGRADGVVLTDGSRRRADLVVANADARQVYDSCRVAPLAGPRRCCDGRRLRCPDSCSSSPSTIRPARRTTRCCSPRTTTRSSTRSSDSAAHRVRSRDRPCTSRPPPIPRSCPPREPARGSCW